MTDQIAIAVICTPVGCLGTVTVNGRLSWRSPALRADPDHAESDAIRHADRLRDRAAKRGIRFARSSYATAMDARQ